MSDPIPLTRFADEGACVGHEDPGAWHDVAKGGQNTARMKTAIAICRQCPVRALCADWAIKREEFGIYGGLTPKQRAVIRSEWQIKRDAPSNIFGPSWRYTHEPEVA